MIGPFFAPAIDAPRGGVLISRPKAFEAAHAYRGERFGPARRVHGHNYVLTATIAGAIDPATHFVLDFRRLDDALATAVSAMDHRRLDVEYAALHGREPGVEALAVAAFDDLAPRVASLAVRLAGVRVAETADLWADHDGGDSVELTRAYGFSAAHRLARPGRSPDDERALYGKCANPHPHGHDYRVEITLAGRPDPQTGLLCDLARLDDAVERCVTGPFDHRYLNEEVPPFDRVVPTAERIAEDVWRRLAGEVPGLDRIVIYETPRSAFTYRGP